MTDAARSSSRTGWLWLGPLGARRRSSNREGSGGTATAQPRGRLFRKYVLLIVGLVSLVLLVNSALDFWFSYDENKAALFRIQQEKAGSAARRIEQFVDEIERQLGWTTAPQWAASPIDQRKFDYVRLLRQVPAITELIQLDDAGKEQLKVSRLAMDVVGSEKDYSGSPSFIEARQHRVWFSPVYFRKESEPYMTVALARAGRNAGVTIAEVNLKLIWDVITGLKIGQGGYAYVVDRDGRLIAHPDISLVLRNTDLTTLPQVAAARAETPSLPSPASGGGSGWGRPADQAVMVAKGIDSKPVLTAHAAIAPLGWTVFVELPLSEALAPLYGSALRTAGLLVVALVLATSSALLLARRMTVPIRELQAGAARIGAGELDRHIDIQTGDELEDLAGDFNRMASDLQKSYADLEKKVEDRTAELKEALDQQIATAEVLGVINSSPGDLAPVFDAMLENALRLCEADFGVLLVREGDLFRTAALRGVPAALADFLSGTPREPGKHTAVGRMLDGEDFVHFEDMTAERAYQSGDPRQRAFVELGGTRSYVAVALRKDGRLLGSLAAYRREVRPFTDKQIALLQNFAAQAVIAMENARLITETREALEQQTATAEVLQVMNSSPGELSPVFDAMLEKATRLCEASFGVLCTYDGTSFSAAAMRGVPPAYGEFLTAGPLRPGPGNGLTRVAAGERVVHVLDVAAEDIYRSGEPLRRALVDLGGARSALTVALLRDEALVGAFIIYRAEVRQFTDKQIALVQNFAAQAVIAMENARLLTETREALEQQTATAEVLQVINSSPGDLAPVFDAIVEKAHTLCGAACGSLQLWDGEKFRGVAMRGFSEAMAEGLRQGYVPGPNHPCRRVLEGERIAQCADLAEIDDPVTRAGGVALGSIRTILFVALRKDDVLLGQIVAARHEVRPFSEKEIALVENFAAQAVIAMENARLITETREALEQQTATAEVLQVINSSPGHLAPVFDAILEKAHSLCGATFGALLRFDGEFFQAVAWRDLPEAFADMVRQPFRHHPDNPMMRLVRGEGSVQVCDLREAAPGFHPEDRVGRAATELGGARTNLMVPLRKDGRLLGVITANRQEAAPFSNKQIALLENFAAQAVIAMENARLVTETREALEQQTATAEVLGVINSSPGDLGPVFEAMLEKATALCEAAFGTLLTYDGERFSPAAAYGVPPAFAAFRDARGTFAPPPGSSLERVRNGENLVHITDVATDPAQAATPLVQLGGCRTLVCVALRKDSKLVGAITAYREELRPFTDKQIALLQNFAAQAVIAMENARLLTETREALEQQTATAEVLQVINSSPGDLAPVFEAMLEKAHTLCGAAHGSLQLYDGENLHAVATNAVSDKFADVLRQGYRAADSPAGRALIEGAPFAHIADCAEVDHPVFRGAAELAGIHTVLFVPLRKDGAFLGLISAARLEVRPFSEKEIALLQNFAAQAVIAMENARLLTETREALEQQTATAEVLGVINSSPGELGPVFEAMLEKATTLCEAAHGALFVKDGERYRAIPSRGTPPDFAVFLTHEPIYFDPSRSILAQTLRQRSPIQVTDMQLSEPYRERLPIALAAVELGGTRTLLSVPLFREDALVGIFQLARQEVRPFSNKQIALLQNFAAQAVIAIENARLITETREALEQQTATAEVLRVINSSPGDLAPVFDAMLDKAMRLCEAEFGLLENFNGEAFHAAALHGVPAAFAESWREPRRPSPGLALYRLMQGENLVHVADVTAEDAYQSGNPIRRALADLGGARTGLWVALRTDAALLGAFVIYRKEVRPFSEKQIALLQNFAAQAVIAMENARLITETREALEQQTATAEVLQVINSSPGDLAPVFDAMLDKATRLCEASFGTLWTYDGECMQAAAIRGSSPEYAEYLRQGPHRPSPVQRRLIAGERLVQVADVAAGEGYRSGDPLARALVELGNIRSLLAVPLRKDDAFLGAIAVYRQEVRAFSEKQIALLQNFAAQAVIAIENVRLITELRQRTRDLQESLEYQTATSDVLRVVSRSTFDLESVLQTVVTTAIRLCRADSATIYRNEGGEYRWAAGHMLVPEYEEIERNVRIVPGTGTVVGRAALEGHTVQILDAWTDPLYEAKDDARVGGVHTMIGVPLLREGAPIGVIGLARRRVEAFSEREIQLVTTFADQAVIAIENARLITELRQRTHDLQESLEYQTATSDVLKVISRQTFDLQPVLETVAETAARLCESEMAFILRRDGEVYRAAAALGWSPEYKEYLQRHPIVPSRGTLTGRVVLEGRAVQIADIATDPEYTLTEATTLGEAHTQLGVPLLREDVPIGVIILSRRTVKPFTEKQIELVTTFADQAVIAIENARLLNDLQQRTRDLQESLEYQTASSDVLKVISRSGAELGPVLDTLVETAASICRANSGFIFRLDDGLCRMVASFGIPPEYREFQALNPIAPGRGTLAGRTVLERRAVHIEDAATDPEYTRAEAVKLGRQRTMLGVPLVREDALIGVITLARSHVEPFTEKQIGLVSTFADQAVIAIENARLFGELRARTEELGSSVAELKMLSEVGQAVSSTLDLRAVLSTILNASLGVTWANAGAIFRYIRAERAFRLVEAVGWDEPLLRSVRDLRVAEAETAMGEAAARRMPMQVAELAERPSAPLRDASLAAGFHSALIVPLVGAERILGAILLMRQEAGEFPAETVRLMQTLASQSVLAIQNARLFREIADKSEQLALASQHKSQFLANMSHELRTPLNAILGYAELLVDGIYGALPDRPKGVLDRIQNNGKHLLALINDVLDLAKIEAGQLTLTLEDYSVPEVVKSVVTATEPLATSKGLKFTAALQDNLPMAHGDARRVSQVLLNLVGNAIKFTDKGEVEIRAIVDKGQFVLTVRDTGPGIPDADQERIFGEFQQIDNSNTRKKGGTGLGLAISKRMVEMQGGTISVDSVLGEGSTFRVVLPVHVDEMMEAA